MCVAFSAMQSARKLREVEVHLARRLGAGRHLELDLDAVDRVRLARRRDLERRHDEPDLAGRRALAEPGTDLALRAAREHRAVHVAGSARHRGAGVDVLGDRVPDEALGGDHRDLARIDVGLCRDAEDPAEVVDVAVRVDDRHTGRSPRCSRYSASAAAAVSVEMSGSITITPVSPSTKVMFERSSPRTW